MACCPGCSAGEECAKNGALPEPVQALIDAPVVTTVTGPFTFLDAAIDCQTRDCDARTPKSFLIA